VRGTTPPITPLQQTAAPRRNHRRLPLARGDVPRARSLPPDCFRFPAAAAAERRYVGRSKVSLDAARSDSALFVPTYGESAKPWATVLETYGEMVAADAAFKPISDLAHALAASPFAAAGLCALTSHSDLLLGPSTRVLDNPYPSDLVRFRSPSGSARLLSGRS